MPLCGRQLLIALVPAIAMFASVGCATPTQPGIKAEGEVKITDCRADPDEVTIHRDGQVTWAGGKIQDYTITFDGFFIPFDSRTYSVPATAASTSSGKPNFTAQTCALFSTTGCRYEYTIKGSKCPGVDPRVIISR
jgi:hypothetical protein